MSPFITFILDTLFPPSREALILRALSPHEIFSKLPSSTKPPLPFIQSLFAYRDNVVAELIRSIKNKKDAHAFVLGGHALHRALRDTFPSAVLVPIPLAQKRAKERGYNQCELLVDEVLKLDGENRFQKRTDILMRTRHTGEQKLKTRKERLAGDGIFEARHAHIDHPIVLIDDVTTTGSTLDKARAALLRAGYENVSAFTIAH